MGKVLVGGSLRRKQIHVVTDKISTLQTDQGLFTNALGIYIQENIQNESLMRATPWERCWWVGL